MGDFSTDLLALNFPRARNLLQTIQASSLLLFHHDLDYQDTWLDLILTSSPHLVSSHGQILASSFSRHDLIFLTYILKPPKLPPIFLRIHSYRRMDIEKLRGDAAKRDWVDVM